MKKLLVGVLIAALLFACGSEADPVYAYEYNVEGFSVYAEAPLNENSVRYNLQLARKLLAPSVMTVSEFESFTSTPIYVRRSNTWFHKSGNYDATFGISLGGNMQGLVHELLHAWEAKNYVVDSFRHPAWSAKGYHTLDEQFAASNLNPLFTE